jgi:hypothetical protein
MNPGIASVSIVTSPCAESVPTMIPFTAYCFTGPDCTFAAGRAAL